MFCGTACKEAFTQLVPDVDAFPGHIACSSLSRSEIVVPVMVDDKVWGVLDVDSEALAFFDETDKKYLEYLCDELLQSYKVISVLSYLCALKNKDMRATLFKKVLLPSSPYAVYSVPRQAFRCLPTCLRKNGLMISTLPFRRQA